MEAEAVAGVAVRAEGLHLHVAWLCGAVLILEGYDLAAVWLRGPLDGRCLEGAIAGFHRSVYSW